MDSCYLSEPVHQKEPVKRVYVPVAQPKPKNAKQYKLELARRRAAHQAQPQFSKMMSKADYVYNS